jgi:hypothetical protein
VFCAVQGAVKMPAAAAARMLDGTRIPMLLPVLRLF